MYRSNDEYTSNYWIHIKQAYGFKYQIELKKHGQCIVLKCFELLNNFDKNKYFYYCYLQQPFHRW
jgi:hypothetical protein